MLKREPFKVIVNNSNNCRREECTSQGKEKRPKIAKESVNLELSSIAKGAG